MSSRKYPRFVLAGTHSGVGKTSVSAAVMGALSGQGVHVQPYKVGPDYIDPAFHTFVTGNFSRNLDSWIVAPDELKKLFAKTAPPSSQEISIIEGVMGLYDGNGTASEGGTSHVAQILSAPVVLIVNGEGIGRSLGALVRGYRDFDDGVNVAGVIVNRVSGERHYELLKTVVQNETGLRCFGYLPKDNGVALPHRPLGLVPPSEIDDIRARIGTLAKMAAETIDLDGLMALANEAPEMESHIAAMSEQKKRVRIAVPRDKIFCAYYEDNFDLLRELGTEIIFFDSTIAPHLPENIDGLYIGGGFPEIFASSLTENAALRADIREKLNGGLPAYAEGAGAAYLCRSLTDANGGRFEMVGFFDAEARATKRLPNFGHITVTLETNSPLGPAGFSYRANEFHRLEIFGSVGSTRSTCSPPAYRVKKENGAEWEGGLAAKNTFASLAQVHFYADKRIAENFIDSCERGTIAKA